MNIDYTLIRSNRKTVAIYIRDGLVKVRAPQEMSLKDIERFVLSKDSWITKKLAQSTSAVRKREAFELDYGSVVHYRGQQYPIVAQDSDKMGFDGSAFFLPHGLSLDNIKTAVIEIYKLLAKRDLSEKVNRFASLMLVKPNALKINSAKTRWGSCSAKKRLNFSWMVMMADDECIDYLVVHELAHLIQLNHSTRFWDIVRRNCPDYLECQSRLKKLQQRINDEDWDL